MWPPKILGFIWSPRGTEAQMCPHGDVRHFDAVTVPMGQGDGVGHLPGDVSESRGTVLGGGGGFL